MRVCSRRDDSSRVWARRDPVYVQARSTRSRAYDRMCASSSRFMRNIVMRARRNLESLVENNIPRRDHRSIVRLDWFEKSRLDHLE